MAVGDCDADGLLDGEEVDVYESNPFSHDTDGDALLDGYEAITTHAISFSGFVPEPPVPYILNYTLPAYNLHDLNSTIAYVKNVEINGDVRDGYIEFTIWHERLRDVDVWMRPVNYPWQILWHVWNTTEAVNATVNLKLDLFGTDPDLEDVLTPLPSHLFYSWKDWEIIVYDMEKGCQGKIEHVALGFEASTKATVSDSDNDFLSDGYERGDGIAVEMDGISPGTTAESVVFQLPYLSTDCKIMIGYTGYEEWPFPKATVTLLEWKTQQIFVIRETIVFWGEPSTPEGELNKSISNIQPLYTNRYKLRVNCTQTMEVKWLRMETQKFPVTDNTAAKQFDINFMIEVEGRYKIKMSARGVDLELGASFEKDVAIWVGTEFYWDVAILAGIHTIHVVVLKGTYEQSLITFEKKQFDPLDPDIYQYTPFTVYVDGKVSVLYPAEFGERYLPGTYYLFVCQSQYSLHEIKIEFMYWYNEGSCSLAPICTNPFSFDSDGDYLTDFEEDFVYSTLPDSADTDNDGFGDCCECIGFCTDAWRITVDSDGDGMPDGYEQYCMEQGSWQHPHRLDKRVAVLCGGSAVDANYAEFWNELIFLYDILIFVYNYNPNNIYVCYHSSGQPPSSSNMDRENLKKVYDETRNETSFVD
ncbi:MAG: hypothetical protein ACP5JR_04500, partial [Thermoplasmata archaeon]